jgi:putative transposase
MPRTARIAPKELIYHVLTRGNNRQDIFLDDHDFQKYLDIILKYKEKYIFKLYHYVLMTNHVHLVIEPTEKGGELSQIMKGINLSYAQHYKVKYKHIGHFWQDRYKSIIISKDRYLLSCGSYVELNPVRAGLVKDPKAYPWSSYNALAYGKKNILLDKNPLPDEGIIGDEQERKEYRRFVKEMLEKKSALKGSMDKRLVYGNVDFSRKLSKDFRVTDVIRGVGRPRKRGETNSGKNN